MTIKPKILVVCGRNKKRSRTAESIFKNDSRILIRSAGVSPKSNRKISENDIKWADLILVMEREQQNRIKKLFSFVDFPKFETLDIPDEYEYMDDELIDILSIKINDIIQSIFNI